jgi:hypothetical protein
MSSGKSLCPKRLQAKAIIQLKDVYQSHALLYTSILGVGANNMEFEKNLRSNTAKDQNDRKPQTLKFTMRIVS